jgi:hypothetical protein
MPMQFRMHMRAISVVVRADDAIASLQKVLISSAFLQCRRHRFDNVRCVRRVRRRAAFALR